MMMVIRVQESRINIDNFIDKLLTGFKILHNIADFLKHFVHLHFTSCITINYSEYACDCNGARTEVM